MIDEFKEWKAKQDPFTCDDDFFKQKYPGIGPIPSTMRDIFKELYHHQEIICNMAQVLSAMDDRLDELEE